MEKQKIIEVLNEAYFSEECHERELLAALPELLAGARVFVDVGASLGQYTFHASRILSGGRLYAFEADPVRFEELERNCRKWAEESSNEITAVHSAVSSEDGELKFFVTNSDISGGLFTREVSKKQVDWSEEKVKSVRLDSFFKDEVPDLVKMDVEGAELQVLKGARDILSAGKTGFLIEVHNIPGQINPAEVLRFMESFGYFPRMISGRVFFRKKRNSIMNRLKNHAYCMYYRLVRSG